MKPPATPRQLVAAGREVLDQRGVDGLTVRAVADRAGCSTIGIYTWFGDKAGLLDAIVADGLAELSRSIDPANEAGDPVEVGLAYRRWAVDHPTLYVLMLGRSRSEHRVGPATRWGAARAIVRLRRLLERWGATEPSTAATHLLATVHGHVMLELVGMRPIEDDDADARFERVLRSAIAGLEATAATRVTTASPTRIAAVDGTATTTTTTTPTTTREDRRVGA